MPENINTLAVGYEDGGVRIWDLRALGKVAQLEQPSLVEAVTSLAFSTSGRLLYASHINKPVV
jgi:WD40 repeat protein